MSRRELRTGRQAESALGIVSRRLSALSYDWSRRPTKSSSANSSLQHRAGQCLLRTDVPSLHRYPEWRSLEGLQRDPSRLIRGDAYTREESDLHNERRPLRSDGD